MNMLQATDALRVILDINQSQIITPFLLGKPGIGKSELIKQIKQFYNYEHLLDIRLSQHDNTDIKGIPHKNDVNQISWLTPEFMPVEGNPKFEGTSGILFFDEFNRARQDVLQSVFEAVYDRSIGGKKILSSWKIVCAGNYGVDDGCTVNEMDSALKNRFLFLDIDDIQIDVWVDWAKQNNVLPAIILFLQKLPSFLYKEDSGNTITPRTWVKFSQILQQNSGKEREVSLLLGRGIIYSALPQFIEHLDSIKKIEPKQIFNDFDKIATEVANLQRADVHELIDKMMFYIKDNKKKFASKQYENFKKFFDSALNEDNKISIFETLKKNDHMDFITKFCDIHKDTLDFAYFKKIWENI